MIARVCLTIAMLLAALGPAASAADAKDIFQFWFKNCDQDDATIDVDVFDGQDMARRIPYSMVKGLPYGVSFSLHCIGGTTYGYFGCSVYVHKESKEYQFRVEEDSCWVGRVTQWSLPYPACPC